jgi:hypothetical protein
VRKWLDTAVWLYAVEWLYMVEWFMAEWLDTVECLYMAVSLRIISLSGIFLAEAYLTAFCYASWALGKSPGGYDPYEATALMFCVITWLHSSMYSLYSTFVIKCRLQFRYVRSLLELASLVEANRRLRRLRR